MDKKQLYENIMRQVSKSLKETLDTLEFNGKKLKYNIWTQKYEPIQQKLRLKKIHQQRETSHGYWENTDYISIYYYCEDEYTYLTKAKEVYEIVKEKDICFKDMNDPILSKFEQHIGVRPNVTVSDGFAVSGGKTFDAIGVSTRLDRTGPHEFTTIYYIRPNSITNEKNEKVKGWWV